MGHRLLLTLWTPPTSCLTHYRTELRHDRCVRVSNGRQCYGHGSQARNVAAVKAQQWFQDFQKMQSELDTMELSIGRMLEDEEENLPVESALGVAGI